MKFQTMCFISSFLVYFVNDEQKNGWRFKKMPGSFCRLCLKPYNTKKDPRSTITDTHIKRLELCGISFKTDPTLNLNDTTTICRDCDNGLKSVEKADIFRQKWKKSTSQKRRHMDLTDEADETDDDDDLNTEENQADSQSDPERDAKIAEDEFNKKVADTCQNEIGKLEQQTFMKDISVESLVSFNDFEFYQKVEKICPVLTHAINGAIKGVGEPYKHVGARTLCVGLLFKARFFDCRANVICHRNDQLFFAAGIKRKCFKWFNRLGVTNSYRTALKKNKELADGYDEEVKEWKMTLETIQEEEEPSVEYSDTGDNLDINVQARHQGNEQTNQDFHWFHHIAIKERLLSSQDHRPEEFYTQFGILPNSDTCQRIKDEFIFLVAKSIVSHLPAFEPLKKHISRHIDHPFVKEMSEKSTVIPLGLIFANENTSAGIGKILREVQEKYVPMIVKDDKKQILKSIPFLGDLLTYERAINFIRAVLNGLTDIDRLEGIEPQFSDWHLRKTLYEVKDKLFRVRSSGKEHGTVTWAMNVMKASNAKKGPHKAMNAYSEYTDKELDGQIAAMTMDYLNMKNFEDDPIPEDIKNGTPEVIREYIQRIARYIVEKFTVIYQTEKDKDPSTDPSEPKSHFFFCVKCDHQPFQNKAERDLHEQIIHSFYRDTSPQSESDEDYIMNYQEALFTINLLLRNIHDAIREGDGERLINSYKIALLYFKATRHHKYGLAILNLLASIESKPDKAFKLIWGRFVNTHGFRGRNISRDLHLEHLNRFLKGLLKPLHSNLNEENAKRIAFSIKNLRKIVENFEDTLQIKEIRGSKRAIASLKDIKKLTLAYVAAGTFERKSGREYESFTKFNKRVLSNLNDNFMTWVSRKCREFKENIFVFDDEEEEEEHEDEESESEDSDSEIDDSDSESDDSDDETNATKERLISLCQNLQEKIDKLRKK